MDKQKIFLFLRYYYYSRRYFLLIFLVFFLSLFFFSFVFEEDRAMIHYISLLLFFLSSFFLFADICSVFKSFKNQLIYKKSRAQTPLEVLLMDRLEQAEAALNDQKSKEQEIFSDLLDYYTLWAHQIKTPIAASSLLVGDLQAESKQQLEQELFKIESYVNLVLQYLRLESFHEDLVIQKENLQEMVKEVVKKYALFFIQQGLSLELHDLDRDIITDRKWFLVILEQILSNSLKYTRQGGIEIYVKDQALYLKDTGLGIQNSDILRVFERGFSGYNGRLTQQSSGLGLYLSKKISDKLGHTLSLESTVGQGTTVKIGLKEQALIFE